MLSNPRARVLWCVDDDDDCRVMLSALLQIRLVEARTVGTSAAALRAIQTIISMKTTVPVKLIRKRKRRLLRARARIKSPAGSNRWSKSVSAWVDEFQKRDRGEAVPAFDSLFNGSSDNTEGAD